MATLNEDDDPIARLERLVAILEGSGGDGEGLGQEVTQTLPADAGQSLIVAVRELCEGGVGLSGVPFAAVGWAGDGLGLDAGVEAVARRLGVEAREVWEAARDGDMRVVRAVLEACAGHDWLEAVEGRGGRPLTPEEAGLVRAARQGAEGGVVVDMAAERATRRHWWSRR